MLTAIRIRNGMDHDGFVNHISYSSGQPNNKYTNAGAATIIEIFKVSRLIEEKDGKLIYTHLEKETQVIGEDDQVKSRENEKNHEKEVEGLSETIKESRVMVSDSRNGNLNINIQITITSSVGELDELASKLSSVIKSIKAND
jgi:hypothetical protein